MIVTAWNNGAHNRNGSGYGFKVHAADRDEFFKKEWKSIMLEIEGEAEAVEIAIDPAHFWGETIRELAHPAVGKWLRHNGLAPWRVGNAPTFVLEPLSDNRFKLVKPAKGHPAF